MPNIIILWVPTLLLKIIILFDLFKRKKWNQLEKTKVKLTIVET